MHALCVAHLLFCIYCARWLTCFSPCILLQMGSNYYKIVETIENDLPLLSVAPALWEKDGKLMWPPPGKIPEKVISKNPSIPPGTLQDGWIEHDCVLKRTYISTYMEARNVMREMSDRSDTSDVDPINSMKARRTFSGRKIVAPTINADDLERMNYNQVPYGIYYCVLSIFWILFWFWKRFVIISACHEWIPEVIRSTWCEWPIATSSAKTTDNRHIGGEIYE